MRSPPRPSCLPADWQKRLPQSSHALHLDHRVPGAQGQSLEDQGLARPGEAGHPGGDAQSEDLGRRALGLSGGLGLCGEGAGRQCRTRPRHFVAKLYKHVPVLDTGARGSTITFAKRGIGDVLLSWENEAHLALKESGGDKYQIVYPSNSILAEPPVALVDKNVDRHRTREVAEAYLQFLYTPQAQEIEAKDFYRPRDPERAAKHKAPVPELSRSTRSTTMFGGWAKAQAGPFRRWRRVRPDLQARAVSVHGGAGVAPHPKPERVARLRPFPGLHALLSERDRADPAGGAGHPAVGTGVGRISGRRSPRRACWRRCSCPSALPPIAAAINSVFGLIIAWVLVRYRFPGKTTARCADRSALRAADGGGGHRALRALCAAMAGSARRWSSAGIKIAYTPWGVVVAMIFIGLPFVVRTLQPVLAELGRGCRKKPPPRSARRGSRPSAA